MTLLSYLISTSHIDFINNIVGQLVAERPGRAQVLESWGIDYCCGGKRQLGEACAAMGIEADAVANDLAAFDAMSSPDTDTDWSQAPLLELAEHIVTTHHEYLRQELP